LRYRRAAESTRGVLEVATRLFAALELLLLVVFFVTLIDDGMLGDTLAMPWLLLWLVALVGLLPALFALAVEGLTVKAGGPVPALAGGAIAIESAVVWVAAPWLVLAGVLALRAAVIFSAQA
jgi:polysulfide reductase chain C